MGIEQIDGFKAFPAHFGVEVEPAGALVADALFRGARRDVIRRIQPLLAREPASQLRVWQRV